MCSAEIGTIHSNVIVTGVVGSSSVVSIQQRLVIQIFLLLWLLVIQLLEYVIRTINIKYTNSIKASHDFVTGME